MKHARGWVTCPVCKLDYPTIANPMGCPNSWRQVRGEWIQRPERQHDPKQRAVFAPASIRNR